MEKTEPTLVPEWLKNTGSSTGGGSISRSDDHSASRVARNKSFVNSNNGHDFGRSSSSERTTSSYFRRSSSSNSSSNFRSYSSFSRNQRDRGDWEKDTYDFRDQDKPATGNRRYRDFPDPLRNTSSSKFETDGLRRSQSMISGQRGDTWPKKVVTDSSDASARNTNGVRTRGSPVGGPNKVAFERDFPSLGAEERAVTPEVGRVPSPGLSTAIQSLPGTSALIGGEKWTSALAEVPMLVGSNGAVSSSVQQSAPSSSASGSSSSTTGLNMAEAVAHGPSRAQNTPQLSVGTQRLEELVIKQSRQLIPVTPSMPKTLVLNSSDKHKNKVGQHQHHSVSSSIPVNHSPRGGPAKGDISKSPSTVGKLHVLKPVRDKNGVTPIVKDNSSPKAVSSPLAPASPAVSGSAATRVPPVNAVLDRKPVLSVLEKRPTSQARSRNDFFNLVRKQSVANSSSSAIETGTVTFPDKHAELEVIVPDDTSRSVEVPLSLSPSVDREGKVDETCNGDVMKYVSNGKKHPSADPIISEEEEAAFLRSLGWEENDEEGGLTDEEISSFYRDITKYINSKPSLKILQGVQLKFLLPLDSQIEGIDGISEAKLES